MKIRAGPGSLADLKLEAPKTAIQELSLAPLPTGSGIIYSQVFQVLPDQGRQCGISVDCDLPHFLDEVIIKR